MTYVDSTTNNYCLVMETVTMTEAMTFTKTVTETVTATGSQLLFFFTKHIVAKYTDNRFGLL